MPTWLAAGLLVASIGLTYFCCVRPMRRGGCAVSSGAEHRSADHAVDAGRRTEIDRLRRDIEQARQELREPGSTTATPRP